LVAGRWREFARLADHLEGGRYPEVPTAPAPDLSSAQAIFGVAVARDDLQMVEGIGPQIEELCHRRGIRTWAALASTAPQQLRDMLDAAGPRFRMHDPGTWPMQAYLLAHGHWDEHKMLTELLRGGRAVERTATPAAPPAPDLATAEQALGVRIARDDLKVVEGIGPKIEE
jgi:predicted flap endonuclease-1-like 5' DNA nuclease